jgi:hypothetical protein
MNAVGFKGLAQLEMRQDEPQMAFYAFTKKAPSAQRRSIPNKKPASAVPIASLYDTTFDGEQRQQGRTAEKRSIPLKQVWKVFFISAGSASDASLFAHAAAERSIAQWTFYLNQVSSIRRREATDNLILVADDCVDRALGEFRGGDFSASGRAFDLVELMRRHNTASTPAVTLERRVAEINEAVQEVRVVIDRGDRLFRERKWDDALSAWAPIAAFSTDPALPEFANSYLRARRESHDLHVQAASDLMAPDRAARRFSLDDAVLRQALTHCETAVSRMPQAAEGQACRVEAITRIAASEAKRLRATGEFRRAAGILISISGSQGANADLERTLGELNRELSRDLYNAAGALLGSAPPAAPASNAERTALRAALEYLRRAEALSPAPESGDLLQHVSEALAKAHVSQARQALDNGQPFLAFQHAQAARSLTPDDPDQESVLAQSRDAVEARSRIHVAVNFIFTIACGTYIKEFTQAAESAIAGLPNVRTIAPKEAKKHLAAKKAATETKDGAYALISAKITTCSSVSDSDYSSPGGDEYVNEYVSEGPSTTWMRIEFAFETQDSLSRNHSFITGRMESSFLFCNTRDQDCDTDYDKEWTELVDRIKTDIRAKAIQAVDGVATHYLNNARASRDPAAAADNYAAFVLMSRDKNRPGYREAVTAIQAYDPELQPEALAK